jgi:hypothetical protein
MNTGGIAMTKKAVIICCAVAATFLIPVILFLLYLGLWSLIMQGGTVYRGDYPAAYTVAINNFFGSSGSGSNGEIIIPSEIGIVETDSHGRVLFYYHEGIDDKGCGYGILQKVADGNAYYYEDDCILCAEDDWDGTGKKTHEEWFTAEELTAFKVRNDWEQEINEEKCTKKTIVSKKPEEKLELKEADFEKATNDWLINNGYQIISDKRIYIYKTFFASDDYGREIYYIRVNEYRLAGVAEQIVLAVMFMPDGTCDANVSVIRIHNMQDYREQMKTFRKENGWNMAYETQ